MPDSRLPDAPDLVRASATCDNCGAAVSGRFCSGCGQRTEALRQPVHHFLRDAFSEFFGLDGRVWRTLGTLLFKPGTLTSAYHAGRRQLYLRPLRVYLTSTLLFFFLLSIIDPVGSVRDDVFGGPEASDSLRVSQLIAQTDSAIAETADSLVGVRLAVKREETDSARASAPSDIEEGTDAFQEGFREGLDEPPGSRAEQEARTEARNERRQLRLERAILATMPRDSVVYADDIRGAARTVYPDTARIFSTDGDWRAFKGAAIQGVVGARTEAERADNIAAFLRVAIGYVPSVLFLILPVFALLLKLLYARRDWFYSEHVVFGLHTHAFAFVIFAAVVALLWVTNGGVPGPVTGMLLGSIPIYFFVAQKRVYRQSWGKTLLKAVLLGMMYNLVLGAGIVGAILLAATVG